MGAGKAQADAAAGCKVKVFVFSTLEDVDKRSKVRVGPSHSGRYAAFGQAGAWHGHIGGLRHEQLAGRTVSVVAWPAC